MKKSPFLIACLLLLPFQSLSAQNRVAVELHGNVSTTTQEVGGTELNPGFGVEAILEYRFTPHMGAYVGWGWNTFSADKSFARPDVDFDETGYQFGLFFNHPVSRSDLSYFVRAGGIYNQIEVENMDGEIIADSGHGVGWQVGVGIDAPLGFNWFFRPMLKYQSLSRNLEMEEATTTVDLNYVSFGVGFAKKF